MIVMDDDGDEDDSDGFEVSFDGWSMEVRRCTMKREEGKRRKEKRKNGRRDGGLYTYGPARIGRALHCPRRPPSSLLDKRV